MRSAKVLSVVGLLLSGVTVFAKESDFRCYGFKTYGGGFVVQDENKRICASNFLEKDPCEKESNNYTIKAIKRGKMRVEGDNSNNPYADYREYFAEKTENKIREVIFFRIFANTFDSLVGEKTLKLHPTDAITPGSIEMGGDPRTVDEKSAKFVCLAL